MEQYKSASECKDFERKVDLMGYYAAHQCLCGGIVYQCENCNGDWHEDETERNNCPRWNPELRSKYKVYDKSK